MQSQIIPFDVAESVVRIDDILTTPDASFEELNSIPSRDRLTFTNGFYVNCSALFIDIRGSTLLIEKYQRPTLARIYRAYISEMVAVFNSNDGCKEISIEGDCVWGIFDTPYQLDINNTFATAFRLASVINILNRRLAQKKGYEPIIAGIGMHYGRALMIKAGYKGSAVNETVWMGDVVNVAAKLCSHANKTWNDSMLMVSKVFYENLNEHNQSLLKWNESRFCYHGNVVEIALESWAKESC